MFSDLWNVNMRDLNLVARVDDHTEVFSETDEFTSKGQIHTFTDKYLK
jgi:hypothetical protein